MMQALIAGLARSYGLNDSDAERGNYGFGKLFLAKPLILMTTSADSIGATMAEVSAY